MPSITSYIFFNGNCAEAMRFYERVLGGKIEMMMTAGESPDAAQFPPEKAKWILHAHLSFDGGSVLASDDMSGTPYKGMNGFSLSLSYKSAADARKIFDALGEGGQVTMPFGKTFWTEGFGMLTDRFGTPWMVGTDS